MRKHILTRDKMLQSKSRPYTDHVATTNAIPLVYYLASRNYKNLYSLFLAENFDPTPPTPTKRESSTRSMPFGKRSRNRHYFFKSNAWKICVYSKGKGDFTVPFL